MKRETSVFGGLLFALSLLFSSAVMAVDSEPFTLERFQALQQEGAKILVDISASWCPDCAKQHEVLEQYQADYPDSGIHVLAVDFDTQKQWVTYFRAPRQSTLILFSGTEQLWFSVAETRKEEIYKALNTLLQ